jgi:hypothetical protein
MEIKKADKHTITYPTSFTSKEGCSSQQKDPMRSESHTEISRGSTQAPQEGHEREIQKKQSIYALNAQSRQKHKRCGQRVVKEENIHVTESKGCPASREGSQRHSVSIVETGKMVLRAGVLISRG